MDAPADPTVMERAARDLDWLTHADLAGYEGLWIAVLDERVVGAGEDEKALIEEVLEEHGERPLVVQVPAPGPLTV